MQVRNNVSRPNRRSHERILHDLEQSITKHHLVDEVRVSRLVAKINRHPSGTKALLQWLQAMQPSRKRPLATYHQRLGATKLRIGEEHTSWLLTELWMWAYSCQATTRNTRAQAIISELIHRDCFGAWLQQWLLHSKHSSAVAAIQAGGVTHAQ